MSPGSSFYEDIFECMQEKEGVLGNEEWKRDLKERENVEMCVINVKSDLLHLYL